MLKTFGTLHKMKAEPPKRENESTPAYERRLRRYPSRGRAQFVIELEAGSIALLELERGQTIELDLPRLKQLATPEGACSAGTSRRLW